MCRRGFADPTIVADVLDVISDISRGGDRLWKPLSINLAELAREVRAKGRLSGAFAEGRRVLGAQHGHFVREARDHAERRILITSDRLGTAAKQAIIIPVVLGAVRQSKGT